MVTVSIIGIVAAIATPSFSTLIEKKQQDASANTLLAELHFARSEAVKRVAHTVLCPSDNQNNCTNSSWQDGRIIFIDQNNNGQREATEELIRIGSAFDSSLSIIGTSKINSNVRYKTNGVSETSGAFTICNQKSAFAPKVVTLNITGRPQKTDIDHVPEALPCSH